MPTIHFRYALAILAMCVICAKAQCGCDTQLSRAVLQDLFVATRGAQWSNSSGWLLDVPVCDWYGITCAGSSITVIDLRLNNLNGTLTDSLAQLANLTLLVLLENQLTGPLPAAWSALTNLENIKFDHNQVTGPLPDAWSALTSLLYIYASFNQLTGPLPAAWSALTNLDDIEFDHNLLTGPLPAAWSALTNLQYIHVDHNQLTGPLPAAWSALTNLQNIDVSNNQLTGCLDICLPTTSVVAANNSFSGPFNFTCFQAFSCEDLAQSVFAGNSFCGSGCGGILPPCSNCTALVDTAADGPNAAVAEVSSQAACCGACLGNAACVAAEWYGATGVCVLKSAVGTKSSKSNVTLLLNNQYCN